MAIKIFDVYIRHGGYSLSFRIRPRKDAPPEEFETDKYKYIFSISGHNKKDVVGEIVNCFKWGGIKKVMISSPKNGKYEW